MIILHYSLGFPPFRSGGLTKFTIDLMQQQLCNGDSVSMIWPGSILPFYRKTRIRKMSNIKGMGSYEIINPQPVPLDEGIKKVSMFTKKGDIKVYLEFLEQVKPEVIHIHTFMGLHREFLEAAREKKIHVVFSAHDFFPICPKVTLFNSGKICEMPHDYTKCPDCNKTALSIGKIILLQSKLYRRLKDSKLVKQLRKRHRDIYLNGEIDNKKRETIFSNSNDYKHLGEYYKDFFKYIDVVHFNSQLTKELYGNFIELVPKPVIIPITHSDILDRRTIKRYNEKIRISYLGPMSTAKGFYLLKEILDSMWLKGKKDFILNVYFNVKEPSPYIIQHKRYTYAQLDSVFECADVVIAPSLLPETFGYTVLEALSYGVPVIISSNVGAKDIVSPSYGWIFNTNDKSQFEEILLKINKITLENANLKIVKELQIMTEYEMSMEIKYKCYLTERNSL